MSQRQQAIDFYHALCTTGAMAQETWDVLLPGLSARGLVFGDRPLTTVLRPLFHTGMDWHYLRWRSTVTLGVFRKMAEAMLADPELRRQVRLTPEEETLIHIPTGFDAILPTARLDSFFTVRDDGSYHLNYVELNGESPASMAYSDVLCELFLETPLMKAFAERYYVEPLDVGRRSAVDALLRIYYQWRGNRSKLPDIVIVDWKGVPTTTEFHLFVRYFARYGVTATICDPGEMEFRGGVLYADGRPVDYVYKRVLTTELLQRYGLNHPIIDALKAGAICMANPFTCKLVHKKASFAVASDERNAHLFTPVEREAIRQHIPWTRVVEERTTLSPEGETIDLLPWASEHRERLVLKPNDEYGGKGVLIGWECEQSEWDAALKAALEEPAIVQARAVIAYEDFPALLPDGSLDISGRLVDSDPFIFNGDTIDGCLVRLSKVTLLNVTAGGGSVVPAFIVDKKD
ncbi:hypothetical protein [Caldilinea sp.]|uniref:hypothetical protein n=1 Tax=Caldilinea sp. TaxID=2293560 RepID=UPI0021DDBCB5|nr:hypothetical protein [Caldilinea sp.]GIV71108.1 MAG: hypothetical protein KatS3mg048_3970 [Caldilinea sp.]